MSTADALQRIFKTLADPTRLRILRLLEQEELVVQELMEVLGMAQSRVSRHLAILREAGLLEDRREGTFVFYRFVMPGDGPCREAWQLVGRTLRDDPTAARDRTALAQVIESRGDRSKSFFDSVGPEWDALRKVFDDDVLRARAVGRLIPPGLRVADVGTGTGVLAVELARLGARVIGIDNAARMLEAARANCARARADANASRAPFAGDAEWRLGDAVHLPLRDAEVDAVTAHMVLHSLPAPEAAIAEMARVVAPGGVVVLVDFVSHQQEWMRVDLGALWLGFEIDEICAWLASAGLRDLSVERCEPRSRGRDLPATFIASARRAAKSTS